MTSKLKKNVNRIMQIVAASITVVLLALVTIQQIGVKTRNTLSADLSITVDGSTSQVLNNQINETTKIVRWKSLLRILNSRSEKYMDGDITAMDS